MNKNKDRLYMKQALELARKGEGYTSPNPMVGAIIVKDGEVVGQGYHQFYGQAHAEVNALAEAGELARGATIYVTLEPCSHYGKTPPCSLKIIDSSIKKAVIAMIDPNPKVAGRGIEQLKEAGIEVEVGIMQGEAEKLNEIFLKYIKSSLPFVYLKTAQTLDGYLATRAGHASWITNQKAREFGHYLRHRVDAILVGINTVLKDNPSLTTRLPGNRGKDSIRIILDPHLKIPLSALVINQDSNARTIIVTGEQASSSKKQALLKKQEVEIMEMALDQTARIPLKKLLEILHQRKISSVLVEGGGHINHSFLKGGLIDKLYAFIAPKILGGNDGVACFAGEGPENMQGVRELKETEYKMIDNNILLIGKF